MGKTYRNNSGDFKRPKKSFKPKKTEDKSKKIKTEYDYNPNYLDEMIGYEIEIDEEEEK